ncbi:MAG: proton-conducting transporter membrane subunit [Candidatus Methanomethylophilaceae archaeon]|nr:proton-conducting transporter membrane subunit [Candidatus Methanomethylophilaceae archaeon]
MIYRGRYVYIIAALSASAAVLALPAVMIWGPGVLDIPFGSVFGAYSLRLGELSAAFLSFSALVFMSICLHRFGSDTDMDRPLPVSQLPLLMLFCSTALMSDDIFLLLLSWEGLSLSTFLLCGFQRENGKHSWRYFAITHMGGLVILCAVLFLAQHSGSFLVSDWNGSAAAMGVFSSSIIMILLLLGFGTKLGLIPFQVWMPGLYQNSPPHSVALVSAVSSNVAVFLLVKLGYSYFVASESSVTLALVIMGLASVSAIYAALQALVQDAPMRVLAYSSMKNMSLVVLMLGLSMLFSAHGATVAASLSLLTALLHTLYHSLFKSLSVLGVSDAQEIVGSEHFIGMGGLARHHSLLSVLFLIGVLSMAALPPFNGFVSEWLMIQSMMEGFALGAEPYRMALPLGVAVLGLSGALGAAAYLRLYGLMFLGRPRRHLEFKSVNGSSLMSIGVLSVACLASGAFAVPLISVLSPSVTAMVGHPTGIVLSPPFTLGEIDPLVIVVALSIMVLITAVCRGRNKNVNRSRTWDCGSDLGPDMQYSAMSFSQPVAKVFHTVLGTRSGIVEGRLFPASNFPDHFWERVYLPLSKSYLDLSRAVRRLQGGSVQSYLGYILAVLMVLMVALR